MNSTSIQNATNWYKLNDINFKYNLYVKEVSIMIINGMNQDNHMYIFFLFFRRALLCPFKYKCVGE